MKVALNRALSKLGILSRAQATEAIRNGRVKVDGRLVRDPLKQVVPEAVRIAVDEDEHRGRAEWRTIAFHKPRGVVTTRHDPQGRRTIYDVLDEAGKGLIAVGRLDLATSGLLILTNDTQLSHAITDPGSRVPRTYTVTVRGRVTDDDCEALTTGVRTARGLLTATTVTLRKASNRESHLIVVLEEGRNRQVRRLFDAIDHEVTQLKRVSLGGLELGTLLPGGWKELTKKEIAGAFPGVRWAGRD